jgi:hypothetical protein
MQDFRSLSEEHQPGMRVVASLNGNVVSKLVELVSGQEHLPETRDEQIKKAG